MNPRYMPDGYLELSTAIDRVREIKLTAAPTDSDAGLEDPEQRLWNALHTARLRCFLQSADGRLRELPSGLWFNWEYQFGAYGEFPSVDFGGDIGWVKGRPMLQVQEFAVFLQPDDAAKIGRSVEPRVDLPPYLRYMLDVAKDFQVRPGSRISKKILQHHLWKNWPSDLPRSNVKARYMATFLGDPEFERGGNLPSLQPRNRRPQKRK